MGLFGVSLRTLGMSPGCHGAVPLQQPTLNLIGYCTGEPCCQSSYVLPFLLFLSLNFLSSILFCMRCVLCTPYGRQSVMAGRWLNPLWRLWGHQGYSDQPQTQW